MLRILILIFAIGAGGTAAWVSMNAHSSPPPPTVEIPAPQRIAQVLVAAIPLEPAATLTTEHMRWQDWPEDLLVDGFIVRTHQPDAPEEFAGKLTRIDLAAGEPIRAEKLILSQGGFLSVTLDPGKRAVAVRISAESTAGGFIMPNDRVDVLRTFSRPGVTGQSQMISETILRNVRVLAIDQTTDTHGSETVLGKTATLELESSEVEIIVAGEASGQLSLSLRSFADNHDSQRIVEKPAPEPSVRIYRGGVLEEVDQR